MSAKNKRKFKSDNINPKRLRLSQTQNVYVCNKCYHDLLLDKLHFFLFAILQNNDICMCQQIADGIYDGRECYICHKRLCPKHMKYIEIV